jgi:hypothetical protein
MQNILWGLAVLADVTLIALIVPRVAEWLDDRTQIPFGGRRARSA